MAFCSKCGNAVKDGDQFCSSCGNPLGDAPTAESTAVKKVKRRKAPFFIVAGILLICAVVGVLYFLYSRPVDFSDNPTAIEQASDSVVLLECYDKDGELYCTGSAFAAFEDGVFVTNYHVVEQEVYSIVAKTEDGTMFSIDSVIALDPERDIAILKTNSTPHILPLAIGSSAGLEKGEKVIAIGSPLGLMNTVSTGVFSGYNTTDTMQEIQFSASISHGSSGGALFNNAGEVSGITSASYSEGQNLNVAVPIQYVVDAKNAPSAAMTIPQFYNTFEHYVDYWVGDILKNKTIKEEHACVYGIVANIEENIIRLVSDETNLKEYQRLQSEYNPIINSNFDFRNFRNLKNFYLDEDTEDWENLCNFELYNTMKVVDLTKPRNWGTLYKVGDIVCIKTSLKPVGKTVGYSILIENEENISLVTP